jgi:NAD(P)-dependent dehydrogenase (short-subunit alcohol dehydrogenase family)
MSDSYLLSGKKAFVTGGKRRIGRGIALALAEAGCDVGINDLHDDDDADKTLDLIRAMGREAEFFQGDISASAQVEAMFAAFLERFGRIDILVNNPYGGTGEPFLELSEENWDQNLDVGLKGFFPLLAASGARHGGAGRRRSHRQYLLGARAAGVEKRHGLRGRQSRRVAPDRKHGR